MKAILCESWGLVAIEIGKEGARLHIG